MSAHWNGEKELRFIRMLCEREDGRRGGTGLNDMKVRVGVRPSDRYEHLNELTMGFKLGRGVPVELFEARERCRRRISRRRSAKCSMESKRSTANAIIY